MAADATVAQQPLHNSHKVWFVADFSTTGIYLSVDTIKRFLQNARFSLFILSVKISDPEGTVSKIVFVFVLPSRLSK